MIKLDLFSYLYFKENRLFLKTPEFYVARFSDIWHFRYFCEPLPWCSAISYLQSRQLWYLNHFSPYRTTEIRC